MCLPIRPSLDKAIIKHISPSPNGWLVVLPSKSLTRTKVGLGSVVSANCCCCCCCLDDALYRSATTDDPQPSLACCFVWQASSIRPSCSEKPVAHEVCKSAAASWPATIRSAGLALNARCPGPLLCSRASTNGKRKQEAVGGFSRSSAPDLKSG